MREKESKSRHLAKNLRGRMTDAEVILWSRLRRNAVYGRKFRRQHPVGPYIADFGCVLPRLIIEVDCATHGSQTELEHDRRRDAFLRRQGWRVVRISNNDVYKNLDAVIDMIFALLPPPPAIRRAPPP